jgi:hypothetical protein
VTNFVYYQCFTCGLRFVTLDDAANCTHYADGLCPHPNTLPPTVPDTDMLDIVKDLPSPQANNNDRFGPKPEDFIKIGGDDEPEMDKATLEMFKDHEQIVNVKESHYMATSKRPLMIKDAKKVDEPKLIIIDEDIFWGENTSPDSFMHQSMFVPETAAKHYAFDPDKHLKLVDLSVPLFNEMMGWPLVRDVTDQQGVGNCYVLATLKGLCLTLGGMSALKFNIDRADFLKTVRVRYYNVFTKEWCVIVLPYERQMSDLNPLAGWPAVYSLMFTKIGKYWRAEEYQQDVESNLANITGGSCGYAMECITGCEVESSNLLKIGCADSYWKSELLTFAQSLCPYSYNIVKDWLQEFYKRADNPTGTLLVTTDIMMFLVCPLKDNQIELINKLSVKNPDWFKRLSKCFIINDPTIKTITPSVFEVLIHPMLNDIKKTNFSVIGSKKIYGKELDVLRAGVGTRFHHKTFNDTAGEKVYYGGEMNWGFIADTLVRELPKLTNQKISFDYQYLIKLVNGIKPNIETKRLLYNGYLGSGLYTLTAKNVWSLLKEKLDSGHLVCWGSVAMLKYNFAASYAKNVLEHQTMYNLTGKHAYTVLECTEKVNPENKKVNKFVTLLDPHNAELCHGYEIDKDGRLYPISGSVTKEGRQIFHRCELSKENAQYGGVHVLELTEFLSYTCHFEYTKRPLNNLLALPAWSSFAEKLEKMQIFRGKSVPPGTLPNYLVSSQMEKFFSSQFQPYWFFDTAETILNRYALACGNLLNRHVHRDRCKSFIRLLRTQTDVVDLYCMIVMEYNNLGMAEQTRRYGKLLGQTLEAFESRDPNLGILLSKKKKLLMKGPEKFQI